MTTGEQRQQAGGTTGFPAPVPERGKVVSKVNLMRPALKHQGVKAWKEAVELSPTAYEQSMDVAALWNPGTFTRTVGTGIPVQDGDPVKMRTEYACGA